MDELSDLELDATPPSPGPQDEPQGDSKKLILLVVVILAFSAAGLGFWWSRQPKASEGDTVPVAAAELPRAAVTPVVPDEAPADLPVLSASDEVVRGAIQALSSRPELAKWLVTDDLLRRLVVSVDNVSEGRAPTDHLRVLRPERGFEARPSGSFWVPGPSSYRRFDSIAGVFGSLDPQETARLIEHFEPLLNEAYRELGYPDGNFRRALGKAIAELSAVPSDVDSPQLVPRLSSYKYRDETLESLSLAQKQLLRMGPQNVERINGQLLAIAQALDLEVDVRQ